MQALCHHRVVGIANKQPTFEDDEDVDISVLTEKMFLEAEATLE